jgi:predicted AlkP superfamily pyrophosphatase or phosphodiesterase
MICVKKGSGGVRRTWMVAVAAVMLVTASAWAQAPKGKPAAAKSPVQVARPRLVVMIVVDQMRADYVDKFRGQWSNGLSRLVAEGAWFRAAAYPYAATETCPGHATVSTGAFPSSHGMVANSWWDREAQKMVTCTSDPNVKNTAYAGGTTKGGDSAWQMKLPSYAEELKFQTGGASRVVTFSLKARAAITMAGHKADAATWLDFGTGAWVTSSAYGSMPFIDEFARKHPMTEDYGKSWSLSMPKESYWYDEKALGASAVEGWGDIFPFVLRGKEGANAPDAAYYEQWATSPFSDTYLTKMAELAVDSLGLGQGESTDYLGVSYSSVDLVGHAFGPQSWEIQDILVRLDKTLGELFTHLDLKVGRGNYVVALTGDHGVAPIPLKMQQTGFGAGVLSLPDLKDRMERALEPFHYIKPAIARMVGESVYFSAGAAEQLKQDPAAMKALTDAALTMPGVAAVYRAEELNAGNRTLSQARTAAELSYFPGRSGDLYVLYAPYWRTDTSAAGEKRYTGTSHGTPYYYDQRVPVLLMGFGIQPGDYFEPATPADIAPTLGTLTGVTLATHDGRVLSEALQKRAVK